jgi:trigger factor
VKATTEAVNPTRVKLTVEVPFEELKPSLDAAYKKIGSQIQVPGFRRGKVPAAIVDQRIGRAAVLDEAINAALPTFYSQALQENEIQPLSQPEIGPDDVRFADGDSLTFVAELDVRPEIELPAYEGLEVSVADTEVNDTEVDEQVQALRERFGSLTDVERAAAEGDFVTIDLKASQNGEVLEGAEVAGQSYKVGQGTMLDGLDEALVGMSAGETKTFTSQLVGGDLAGADVEVEVAVTAVKEQELPALDDEFAQDASEFDTVDELTADIRERLLRAKRLEQAAEARDAVLEKLLDMVDIPLPDAVVEEEIGQRRQQIDEQLTYAGMSVEQYAESEGQTVEEFEADLQEQVRESMQAQFLLDKVAEAAKVGLNQQDLTQHILRRAQQSGQDPQAYAQHAMEHNHLPQLMGEVVRGKALAAIVESAVVTDASGNRVDLKLLQQDGTLGDPAAEDPSDVEVASADAAGSTDVEASVEQADAENADAAADVPAPVGEQT